MPEFPRIKPKLKIMGRQMQIAALKIAVTPEPAKVKARLKRLVQTFGTDALALLLDVRPSTVATWYRTEAEIGATSRRAVWTLYGMVYAPHELATLFDYATYGRFTEPPAGQPSKPPRKRDSKGKFLNDPPKQ